MPVIKATEIAPGDIIPVETDGLQLLLVADFDGSIYCVANVCPHLGTPLDQVRRQRLFLQSACKDRPGALWVFQIPRSHTQGHSGLQ